jgi:hypothetical protein
MLRRTATYAIFSTNLGPAKHCGIPHNDNIDELIQYVKHAKKLRQYYGSHFQRLPDREYFYALFGGPRAGRFTIRRAHTKKQFHHHNATYGRYAIHHTNPTNAYSGVGSGGMMRDIWSNQVTGTNSWWDVTFKMNGKDLSKDKAIEWMEQWGVKYRILDEVTQPRMEDMSYVKHKLYVHNFPWIRDPIVTRHGGDPDHWWKGRETIDYKEHGATSASVANEFRTLWGIKPSAYAQAQAAEAKAAEKADSKKDAKASSDKRKDASKGDKEEDTKAAKKDGKAEKKDDVSSKSERQESKSSSAASEKKEVKDSKAADSKPKDAPKSSAASASSSSSKTEAKSSAEQKDTKPSAESKEAKPAAGEAKESKDTKSTASDSGKKDSSSAATPAAPELKKPADSKPSLSPEAASKQSASDSRKPPTEANTTPAAATTAGVKPVGAFDNRNAQEKKPAQAGETASTPSPSPKERFEKIKPLGQPQE